MYSKALRMNYNWFPALKSRHSTASLLIFEDGTCYTMREAVILAKAKNDCDIKAVHMVKKIFGGEVFLEQDEKEDDSIWYTAPDEKEVQVPVKIVKKPDSEILKLEL